MKAISATNNIIKHKSILNRENRKHQYGHRSIVLWFTGLSGAGKSTLAHSVEEKLFQKRYHSIVLDGDNVRHGLCSDLGFSDADRKENIRRIGETAKLMLESGIITLTAFISPFKEDRETVRNLMPHGDFKEVYCKASIETCISRDIKGLYKLAREGKIKNYTGIDSPYEEPVNPDLIVDTEQMSLDESVSCIIQSLANWNVIDLSD